MPTPLKDIPCEVPGCSNLQYSKRMCTMHYSRARTAQQKGLALDFEVPGGQAPPRIPKPVAVQAPSAPQQIAPVTQQPAAIQAPQQLPQIAADGLSLTIDSPRPPLFDTYPVVPPAMTLPTATPPAVTPPPKPIDSVPATYATGVKIPAITREEMATAKAKYGDPEPAARCGLCGQDTDHGLLRYCSDSIVRCVDASGCFNRGMRLLGQAAQDNQPKYVLDMVDVANASMAKRPPIIPVQQLHPLLAAAIKDPKQYAKRHFDAIAAFLAINPSKLGLYAETLETYAADGVAPRPQMLIDYQTQAVPPAAEFEDEYKPIQPDAVGSLKALMKID